MKISFINVKEGRVELEGEKIGERKIVSSLNEFVNSNLTPFKNIIYCSKKTDLSEPVRIYTDGAYGEDYATIGIMMVDKSGHIIDMFGKSVPAKGVRDVEYKAALKALDIAEELGAEEIMLKTDNWQTAQAADPINFSHLESPLAKRIKSKVRSNQFVNLEVYHSDREEVVVPHNLADIAKECSISMI